MVLGGSHPLQPRARATGVGAFCLPTLRPPWLLTPASEFAIVELGLKGSAGLVQRMEWKRREGRRQLS